MRIAIMQPYLFPYIGYFQLIHSCETFVFYDDVNFIKNGWINRNRILISGKPAYLTVQLKDASTHKKIREIEFTDNRPVLLKTIRLTYAKAPYFKQAMQVIEAVLDLDTTKISDLAIESVIRCCEYAGLNRKFEISGTHYPVMKKMDRADRLIDICHANGSNHYINAPGGQELYDKDYFRDKGITLKFLEPGISRYHQNMSEFVPGLSIIDMMMFSSPAEIAKSMNNYNLI
jgi:hypothetical protein